MVVGETLTPTYGDSTMRTSIEPVGAAVNINSAQYMASAQYVQDEAAKKQRDAESKAIEDARIAAEQDKAARSAWESAGKPNKTYEEYKAYNAARNAEIAEMQRQNQIMYGAQYGQVGNVWVAGPSVSQGKGGDYVAPKVNPATMTGSLTGDIANIQASMRGEATQEQINQTINSYLAAKTGITPTASNPASDVAYRKDISFNAGAPIMNLHPESSGGGASTAGGNYVPGAAAVMTKPQETLSVKSPIVGWKSGFPIIGGLSGEQIVTGFGTGMTAQPLSSFIAPLKGYEGAGAQYYGLTNAPINIGAILGTTSVQNQLTTMQRQPDNLTPFQLPNVPNIIIYPGLGNKVFYTDATRKSVV